VAESETNSSGRTWGIILIVGALAIGVLLYAYFPMPQRYSTEVGGEELVFTTECTLSGDVIWDPGPAVNPDHVTMAEDYCQRWAGPVVALSLLIPVAGVVGGAFLLARPEDEEDEPNEQDAPDEPAVV
jgi:hypothetical protein